VKLAGSTKGRFMKGLDFRRTFESPGDRPKAPNGRIVPETQSQRILDRNGNMSPDREVELGARRRTNTRSRRKTRIRKEERTRSLVNCQGSPLESPKSSFAFHVNLVSSLVSGFYICN
jgi:hypothetical protein